MRALLAVLIIASILFVVFTFSMDSTVSLVPSVEVTRVETQIVQVIITETPAATVWATTETLVVKNCYSVGYGTVEVCRWPTNVPVIPTQAYPIPFCATPDPSQLCVWRTPRPTPSYPYPSGG